LNTTRYVHTDHLGSVDVIAGFDPLGAVLIAQELSFDAWGQRRNASESRGQGIGLEYPRPHLCSCLEQVIRP
jgi:hypothetical protein